MKEREIRLILEKVCQDLDARSAARMVMVPAAVVGASLAFVAAGCSGDEVGTTPVGAGGNAGSAGSADGGGDALNDQDGAAGKDTGPTIEYGAPPWDADSGPQVDYMAPDAGNPEVDSGPQIEYMAPDAGDPDADAGPLPPYIAPDTGTPDVDSGPQMDYAAPDA
jgi:hypothetical protein